MVMEEDGDGDEDAGGDDWKHAVHDMFVLVAQQQACAHRYDRGARAGCSVFHHPRLLLACGAARGDIAR